MHYRSVFKDGFPVEDTLSLKSDSSHKGHAAAAKQLRTQNSAREGHLGTIEAKSALIEGSEADAA